MASEDDGRRAWDKVLGIALNTIFAVGVLVYVAFYTENFNTFQKIVVLLVALILYTAARALIRIAFHTRRSLRRSLFAVSCLILIRHLHYNVDQPSKNSQLQSQAEGLLT